MINDKKKLPILILIPVFNDWMSLAVLMRYLDRTFAATDDQVEALIVDDASTQPIPKTFLSDNFKNLSKVNILKLRRNLGHQRAITVGLAYVEENLNCKAVIVMDGDGEDDPKDVLRLIEKCFAENPEKIIFAQRTQRSESKLFKIFYKTYRMLYRLLTGYNIQFGNFSIIPYSMLQKIVVVSEVWNHYAAGILNSKIPYLEIPTKRSKRIEGNSKMNLVMLITHGLSAISVYGETIGVRLLIASCILIAISVLAILTAVTIKFATDLAIPGWTSYIVALFFIVLMQAILLSSFFIFVVLNSRNNLSFLPKRDHKYFILKLETIFSKQ